MPNPSPTAKAVYARTTILAAAAGLRSQLPLALLAHAAGRGAFARDDGRSFRLLRSRAVRLGFTTAAVGEIIADKTLFVPNRIDPGPLAGRLFFGGLTGALFGTSHRRSAPLGFTLGAASAAAGAFAGYSARTTLARKTGLPDPILAIAEDLLAYTLARLALHE